MIRASAGLIFGLGSHAGDGYDQGRSSDHQSICNRQASLYASAFRRLRLTCPHQQELRQNNRVENSHQTVQRRESKLQRFKSALRPAFLGVHAAHNTFNLQPHLVSRSTLRIFRTEAANQSRDAVAAK